MKRNVSAILAALAALASGCATTQRQAPPQTTVNTPAPAEQQTTQTSQPPIHDLPYITKLYHAGTTLLEQSFQLKQTNTSRADARLRQAQQLLKEADTLCKKHPDCEPGQLVDLLSIPLEHQAQSIQELQKRITLLEQTLTPEEAPEAHANGTAYLFPGPAQPITGVNLEALVNSHPAIDAEVESWLTSRRRTLREVYVNLSFIKETFNKLIANSNYPPELWFGIIAQESVFRMHAGSRAGAAGPLQFMPGTARHYGLRVDATRDERYDITKALPAAERYLNDLMQKHNGDLLLALAEYNTGGRKIHRAKRALRRAGLPITFWNMRPYLYRETRTYPTKILAAAKIALNPTKYNAPFSPVDTTVIPLTLQRDAALGALAICIGGDAEIPVFRTLRNLNPAISEKEVLPAGTRILFPQRYEDTYDNTCLEGSLIDLADTLHKTHYPDIQELHYTIRRGDTLARIVRKHQDQCGNLSVRELRDYNNITNSNHIIAGKTLKIPCMTKQRKPKR
ncbi:LysM peptidoglycan-binding domain-containing protein [Candidatus Woesearchaeota archaeon]|nr:MAG: LysM peptidoglycan-binding domain-containing protein [Candidatus Woesearchaeota archaeon]